MLDATVQNLVARATWHQGFVRPDLKYTGYHTKRFNNMIRHLNKFSCQRSVVMFHVTLTTSGHDSPKISNRTPFVISRELSDYIASTIG